MSLRGGNSQRRILVIDDEPEIQDDFRRILAQAAILVKSLTPTKSGAEAPGSCSFEIDCAAESGEALRLVRQALSEERPYAAAFVDIRLPVGLDGIQTTKKIWEVYPDLHVVLCTGYPDYSWGQMMIELGQSDRLLILKKPYDPMEVLQMASALSEKWRLLQASKTKLSDLERMVDERTSELRTSRAAALNMMEDAVEARAKTEAVNVDLKRRIEQLERAEAQIREQASLLALARDAIFVHDLEGRITFVNKALERMYGWTAQEAVGSDIRTLLYPDVRGFEDAKRLLLQHGDWTGELHQATKEGREVVADSRWTLLRDPRGAAKSVLVINTDITEKKQLAAQFARAQKMEAIGQLAGGIAHDFNNILGAILMNTELAATEIPANSAAAESLDGISKASRRATDLVKQILAFSRQDEQERQPIQLRHIVGEALKLLRASVPSTIGFKTHLVNVPAVLADPTKIHQIIMNLGTNAWHAMRSQPGTLKVELARMEVDAEYARAHADLRPGDYVRLSVSDTGCGMDRATVARIFEPFFTTKAPGEGTGLGLSVVHGIMKDHDGAISVYSQPGEGTTFHLYFPVFECEVKETGTESQSIPRGQGEHLLFVDDEEPLVNIGRRALQKLGYRVTSTTSVQEAIALFRQQPDQFDLVITDLTMPVMNGANFARRLWEIRQSTRIILTTGYSASMTQEVAREMGFRELLIKPNTARTLGEAVDRVLHHVPSA